uniref:G-protein coupled receptors family 1 profile domain-containing protein n=1 Tax=Biomphalaria glabrata TaxID=6526 RepID=A0A2C9L3U1_BIOGL
MSSEGKELTLDQQSRWIEETKSWYISDELMEYLDLSLTVTVHGIFSVAGVMSNIVNVVIFVKLGLKDSMSIGLLTLSLTDLAVTALQLASSLSYMVKLIYESSPLDPWLFGGYFFSWSRYVAYLISCWITTVISVERCFCVVYPFTVRQMFTRSRCVAVLLAICVTHVGVHLPVFIYAKLEWVEQSPPQFVGNDTWVSGRCVFTVIFNKDSAMWEILSDMIAGISLSVISQLILIICTVWMIYSLKASSKIRQQSEIGHGNDSLKASKEGKTEVLSNKERRLVKVVLFMAINLSACNIPRFVTIAVHHILPGMNLGAYQNLDTLFWEISYLFGTICCTTNTLVYYTLNTKYRSLLKQMLLKRHGNTSDS